MKRFCATLILAVTLCALLAGVGVATAEDTATQYAATSPLDVYVANSDGTSYTKVFSVPVSYYVFVTGASQGAYTPVSYGKFTSPQFYVRTTDLTENAEQDDYDLAAKDATKMGAYLPDAAIALTEGGTVTAYFVDGSSEQISAPNYTIDAFYGIRTESDVSSPLYGTYYFVSVTQTRNGNPVDTFDALIAANSTTVPGLSLGSVLPHHSEEIVDTPSDPTIDTPDGDAATPTEGNVVRNIMIAVICVLCVVVIFLIFRPTKNKKDRYEM